MTNGALETAKTGLTKFNNNDDGGPILLGYLTEAPGTIAVLGFAGSIVAAVLGGVPLGLAALMITAHDTWAASTTNKNTVDVKAKEVVEPPEVEELVQEIEQLRTQEFDRKLAQPAEVTESVSWDVPSRVITTPPPVTSRAITAPPEPITLDPWGDHDLVPVGQSPSVTHLRSALEQSSVKPTYNPRPHPERAVIHTTTEVEVAPSLCDRIVDNLESLLIIGNPGAGKAMLMSNLIPLIRAKYPEIKIVGIDPKGDPKETGYWEAGFDEVYRCNHIKMEDRDYIKWFKAKIDKLKDENENVLYVIDEWTATCRKFAKYDKGGFDSFISFMVGVGSSGPSRRMFVWGIGQIPHAAAMGVSGGERAIFRPIAIASDKRIDMASQFVGTSFVPSPVGGIEGLKDVMRESPRGRAVYYDGWEPMPELVNYSGFDRDRFEFIDPPAIEVAGDEESATPSLDLDMALSFLDDNVVDDPDVPTDFIDDLIVKAQVSPEDKHKMFSEFLVEIKALGQGTVFTVTRFKDEKTVKAWIARWSRATQTRKAIFTGKSQTPIIGLLNHLTGNDFRLLEKVDESTYKVTLR